MKWNLRKATAPLNRHTLYDECTSMSSETYSLQKWLPQLLPDYIDTNSVRPAMGLPHEREGVPAQIRLPTA